MNPCRAFPKKAIPVWVEVGDRDVYNPNGMHDWVAVNVTRKKTPGFNPRKVLVAG